MDQIKNLARNGQVDKASDIALGATGLRAVGAVLLVAYLGEMTQGLITHGGSSIDDALFNGLGGVIGYALFRAVRAMWRGTPFARHDEGAQGAPVPAPPA